VIVVPLLVMLVISKPTFATKFLDVVLPILIVVPILVSFAQIMLVLLNLPVVLLILNVVLAKYVTLPTCVLLHPILTVVLLMLIVVLVVVVLLDSTTARLVLKSLNVV
jgi:hypothetical protein